MSLEPCPCPFCPDPMTCAAEQAKPLPACPTEGVCDTCRRGLGHGRFPYSVTAQSSAALRERLKEEAR